MENTNEKILDLIYSQLTENYFLKGICLEILRTLNKKEKLSEEEVYWQQELYQVLVASAEI